VCSYLREIVHRSLLSLLTYIFTFPSPTFSSPAFPANLSFLLLLSLSLSVLLVAIHLFIHLFIYSSTPIHLLSIHLYIYLSIHLPIYLSIYFLRLLSSFSHLSHPRFPLFSLSFSLPLSFLFPFSSSSLFFNPFHPSSLLGSCCFPILYGICRLRDAATSQECSRPVHLVHTCTCTTYCSDRGSCLRARKACQRLIGLTRSE